MAKQYPIIIDCDPGIDDAIALFLALNYPKFRIDLITTVFGNIPTSKNTRNTLHLLEVFEKSVPVAKGESVPLSGSFKETYAHSKNGFGNYEYEKIKTFPLAIAAHNAIYNVLKANRKTTIICLGPLTNIAKLLMTYEDADKYIHEIVFMGGQKDDVSKVLPYREFNIASDPASASIVINSGISLKMVPMDLGHMAYFTLDECKKIAKTNKIGRMFGKMFEGYKDFHVESGAAVHDACAVIQVMKPELIKTEKAYLQIAKAKDFGYIDCDFRARRPNAKVAVDIDIDGFKEEFFKILNSYNSKKQ